MDAGDKGGDGMKLAELNGVEILSAGKYKAQSGVVEITDTMIDVMVANFQRLKNHIKPPLKLGHTENQILAQEDGQPALGWVSRVYRMGSKMIADLMDVPDEMIEAIKAGHYNPVSPEIYPEASQISGADAFPDVKGPVLKAIAALGAEMPAIKVLEGLKAALSGQPKLSEIEGVFLTLSEKQEDGIMPDKLKELEDKIAALGASLAEKDVELNALKAQQPTKLSESEVIKFQEMQIQFVALTEQIKVDREKSKRENVTRRLSEYLKNEQCNPVMLKEYEKAIFEKNVPEEIVFTQLELIPKGTFKFTEIGTSDPATPGNPLAAMLSEMDAENVINFSEFVTKKVKENPNLRAATDSELSSLYPKN